MRAVVFTFVILLFLTLSPQVVQAQEQPSAAVVAIAAVLFVLDELIQIHGDFVE